jgi:uncharacterized RDD family membrane protein YckC
MITMVMKGRSPITKRWWPLPLAALIILLVVVILMPEIVRPLGIDPGIFEDIHWFFRRLLGQRDRRHFDL